MTKGSVPGRASIPVDHNQNFRQELGAALEEALRMRPGDFARARAHTMPGQVAQALVYGSVLGDTEALGLMMSLLNDGAGNEYDHHGQAEHDLRDIPG